MAYFRFFLHVNNFPFAVLNELCQQNLDVRYSVGRALFISPQSAQKHMILLFLLIDLPSSLTLLDILIEVFLK